MGSWTHTAPRSLHLNNISFVNGTTTYAGATQRLIPQLYNERSIRGNIDDIEIRHHGCHRFVIHLKLSGTEMIEIVHCNFGAIKMKNNLRFTCFSPTFLSRSMLESTTSSCVLAHTNNCQWIMTGKHWTMLNCSTRAVSCLAFISSVIRVSLQQIALKHLSVL